MPVNFSKQDKYNNRKFLHNDNYIFSSESVTEGHPDKICDQISDAILDELIKRESGLESKNFSDENGYARLKDLRCACECTVSTGLVLLLGEVRTQAYVDFAKIARKVIKDIGYTRAKYGFDYNTCSVINSISEQSPDIAAGVDYAHEAKCGSNDDYDKVGAGDQGIIFGYACNDTAACMPMPIYLAHRMSERLSFVRKKAILPYLLPDGKTQVSVRYVNGSPKSVCGVVVSSQHITSVSTKTLREGIIEHVIKPVLNKYHISLEKDAEIFINPTGRFVVGGPQGDTGLTGRKIIVDTYGGMGSHGGGAFSGKDPTKVDRSAGYMARYIAKNIVASGLADKCQIQISYAIGVAHPVSVYIDSFGTAKVDEDKLASAVLQTFDMRPAAILESLDLWRPIYQKTANYGHFGRELPEFYWERVDKTKQLISAIN